MEVAAPEAAVLVLMDLAREVLMLLLTQAVVAVVVLLTEVMEDMVVLE
jgi:hypothetical protein